MYLHPVAEQMLKDAKASGRPNAHLLPIPEARLNFETTFAGLERPDVAGIADVEIPVEGASIPARVYRPGADMTKRAIVVYFHGGGWLLGSVDSHDGVTRRLAVSSDMVVVSVGYRRGPESRFPTAVDDSIAAVRWAAAHAMHFGADAERLIIAGDSAGGNLATVAALSLRNDAQVTIRHQLLVYPVVTTDLTAGFDDDYEGIMLYRDELQWHQDNYLADSAEATDWRVSPLITDLHGSPPATVIMAGADPIRPQAELYAEALRTADVPVEARTYPGMLHGFFGLDMLWDESREAMQFAADQIRAAVAANA